MSINITELDASLTLRNLRKEEKQAVVRLMELSIEETKAAMQARIEKLEALQTIAEDVNTWLIKNKLGGTAHQKSLAESLYALKGEE